MQKSRRYNWNLSPQEPFKIQLQEFPQPAACPNMDYHRAIHFNLILKGGASAWVGFHRFRIQQNDIQLTAPWELHGDFKIPESMSLLSITVDPDLLLNSLIHYRERALALFLLSPEERHGFLAVPAIRALVREHGKKLMEIAGDNQEILKMRRWLAIQCFFAELLNLLREAAFPVVPFHLYQKLAGAFELLQQNHPVTLREAAAACLLSPSRFEHLFQEVCRSPFSAYELRNRLNRAAIRLRQGIPVKLAAVEEGFCDASHFSKHFFRQFGITPGKFR